MPKSSGAGDALPQTAILSDLRHKAIPTKPIVKGMHVVTDGKINRWFFLMNSTKSRKRGYRLLSGEQEAAQICGNL
jgi:hypothetical protein